MKKKINNFFISEVEEGSISLKGYLKHLVEMIKVTKYAIKRKFLKVYVSPKKYNVAVCTIFKNEAEYLKEWIEFNHIIGIEHFYLYNNNSEDNYYEILKDYMDCGIVTLLDWPKNQAQMECYKDAILRYSSECKWMGFIDVDEFVIPKSTTDIYSFLCKFEKNAGAVKIYWRMFGTSGLMSRGNDSFVTESFVVSWPLYYDIGKCFYNTSFEFDGSSEHSSMLHHDFWVYYKGKDFPPVNVFNHISLYHYNKADSADFPIQINHYFTKSYEEYIKKSSKGDVYFKQNPHDEAYFFSHEMVNTSVDYSAYRYLIKMKMNMNRMTGENGKK